MVITWNGMVHMPLYDIIKLYIYNIILNDNMWYMIIWQCHGIYYMTPAFYECLF